MHCMNHHIDTHARSLNVTLPGDILSTNASALRDELFGLLQSAEVNRADWTTLRLDLTHARMIDSVGLNLIVAVIRALKAQNRKAQAVLANRNILRTFQFTRLDQQLEVIQN